MSDDNKREDVIMIPLIKAEGDCARYERIIAKLIGVIVLLVICFTAYVVYDKWDSAQWDYSDEIITEDVDVNSDGSGNANYIKNGGEISNGESESKDDKTETDEDKAAQVDD